MADITAQPGAVVAPVTTTGLPAGAHTEGPSTVNVHPVSVELKHILVFGLTFLILGLGFGYWEMKKQNGGVEKGGDWKVILGFGAAGLLLGTAIGFAVPARRKHHVRNADGRTECYFTD